MIEKYSTWLLLLGAFAWLLLRFSFGAIAAHKSQKHVDGRLDVDVDPLGEALDAMNNFSAAARASTAGAATLRTVFRINNPFSNGSEDLRKTYRQALTKAFAKTDGDAWDAIARAVSISVQNIMLSEKGPDGSTISRTNIMEISRTASMVAVLKGLFDIDDVPVTTLAYICSEIHRLGAWKKNMDLASSNPAVPHIFVQNMNRLISCLCGVFSEAKEKNDLARLLLCSVSGTSEAFNPLDLIIPAFESPWRAVFYTLLAVLQNRPSGADELLSLRDCPARQRPSPLAKAVVYESLRLYPPVRRMRVSQKAKHLQVFSTGGISDVDRTIDAEAILRDSRYWGSAAAEWNPSRFLSIDGEIDNSILCPSMGWIPFAAGGMKCPSAGGFSIRLTTIVAGEVLRQIFPHDRLQWHLEGPQWDSYSASGHLLRPGRDEYTHVDVVVRSDKPQVEDV
ncbi:uncharacterized protein TrAtP1_011898 [Trichoderma atroviride]|uniref:uncharacterized protein n=1 Tax=Hypocrea atroviridis TaxID=63577 RepID=UPI00331C22B2|nr:hypothetical protein TrAtP1_011898 [Trichoderma atroviride]